MNTMRLYIVRHAKAEEESPTGRDADRPLRKRGHRQAEALGAFFAAEDPSPLLVLSSPYLRARETAEHIWAALEIEPQLDDRLAGGRSLGDYLDVLSDLAGCGCVAVVGHNPLCAQLVAVLTQGPAAAPGRHETARAVGLDIDPDAPLGTARVAVAFRPED